jgi:hypothetical protein
MRDKKDPLVTSFIEKPCPLHAQAIIKKLRAVSGDRLMIQGLTSEIVDQAKKVIRRKENCDEQIKKFSQNPKSKMIADNIVRLVGKFTHVTHEDFNIPKELFNKIFLASCGESVTADKDATQIAVQA